MKEILSFDQLLMQQQSALDLERVITEQQATQVHVEEHGTQEYEQLHALVMDEKSLVLSALKSRSIQPEARIEFIKKSKPGWGGNNPVWKSVLGWDMMRVPVKLITPDDIGTPYMNYSSGLFLAITGDIYRSTVYGSPVRRWFKTLQSHKGEKLDFDNSNGLDELVSVRSGVARLAVKHSLFA